MRFACTWMLLLGWLGGCGGEAGAPPPASWVLGSGATVEVASNGRLEVREGDRLLLGTADGRAPVLRTFDRRVDMQLGGFTFRRLAEAERPLRFSGARDEVVRFGDGDGARLEMSVSAESAGEAIRISVRLEGVEGPASVALPVACGPEDAFYGFGAQYDDTDQRGDAFPLWVSEQGIGRNGGANALPWVGNAHTTYFPMPWWIDPARGLGVLIDTTARVLVDLCARESDVAWIEVEATTFDLVVFAGAGPYDVLRQLGDAVGRSPEPPEWAWRPWIAVQGGRDAVLAEADALDAAGVPYGALWAQDWSGRREFAPGSFGVAYQWVADETLYPDFTGMVQALHDRGVRYLGYANPFVVPGLAHYDDMAAQGLLIETAAGEPYLFASLNGESSLPDTTDPEARAYVKGFLRAMVETHGMDGWMSDFGEWLPTDAHLDGAEDGYGYHNVYATEWHRLSREVMDEVRPDGDWVVFSRSGWTGEQEVAQIVWIGDQEADFSPTDGLPTVVPALLSLGLSGIPFVTHDIAGFSGGPSTKELYLRWTELGAFTPIMRTHEGIMREANWDWNSDEETVAHFRRFARIHEALRPEIGALAQEAARTGAPLMRHLALEHPSDPGSRGVSDQFLLGPDLLVAPVVEEGATRRSVYLPPGAWFHVWSGERFEGGRTVEIDAPIGAPPVFARNADRADLRAVE